MSDFRAQQIAIVETYLDAGLLQHKPENVLFAENCTRWEMGYATGSGAAQLRELLKDPAYEGNEAIENRRWLVEGDEVDCFYDLRISGLPEPLKIATRFTIENKLISRIEIYVCAGELQQIIMDQVKALSEGL
ncbi:nuclear transport factor 2 family protein [Zhongshania borealis]|uniref:DUF8021 domain-containing protein n=1 Tax=Zhongshania borealis TaxID=889488 RepID=A0ABP7WWL9_9GAMM|tara:strand:+ start:8012 stop:8410 length:399 start_codon:yes stop_codon:yes gene_type:complete